MATRCGDYSPRSKAICTTCVNPGVSNMAMSEQSIQTALDKGRQLDHVQPKAVAVRMAASRMILGFDNGAEVTVPMSLLPAAVATASPQDAAHVVIEGGGHDLYWPPLDEGLYIPDLCARATFGELAQAA
ncbi:MAG: hypothetical protein B7Z83_05150 [Thiomonas sp. 20-64-5]|nr:MAG: hypothetical protein B7Z83_05150 [Thiomonas sp. 20-64-5]